MILILFVSIPFIFLLNLIVIKLVNFPEQFYDGFDGPQKFHKIKTLRIGGLFFILNVIIIYFILHYFYNVFNYTHNLIIISVLSVSLVCSTEDIKINLKPFSRLLILIFIISIILLLTGIELLKIDILLIDEYILKNIYLNFFFTLFAIIAIINGNNLIDGFNGLMLGFSFLCLSILSIILFLEHDYYSITNLLIIFSLIPIFLLNYPIAKIFMGDGGSFSIGFYIALISIYYSNKFIDLSPWIYLNLVSYQFIEISFSILRKRFYENTSPLRPDKYHLHMLVYYFIKTRFKYTNPNFITSTIIFLFFSPFYFFVFFIYDELIYLIINFISFFLVYFCSYYFLRNYYNKI